MTRRKHWTLPVAAVALGLSAAAPAGASIAEFTGLNAGSPAGIAAGPGAAIWFGEQGIPGGLGRMTPGGVLTEFTAGLTAGADPADVAAGPDGAVWFTEPGLDAIGRLDPERGVSEYPVSAGSRPTAIAAGPGDDLFFTQPGRRGVGRITADGTVKEYAAAQSGATPTDVVTGEDGNVWFTTTGPDGIGRLNPATGVITEFSAGLTPAGAPAGITGSESGKLYFTEPGAGRVGRIKTDGSIEEYAAGLTAGAQPTAIAEGGDGALWFTDADEPGRISRLWPASGQIQEFPGGLASGLSLGDAPGGIAQGPDGNVWYTQRGPLPRIVRMTVPPLAQISTPEPAAGELVRLKASVRPNSQPTTYFFEVGTTTSYGTTTETEAAGEGAARATVSAEVPLQRGAHHHVRVTAENASGTVTSDNRMFYVALDGTILKEKPADKSDKVEPTSTVTPSPVSTTQTVQELPPPAAPVLGETVGVAPISGAVRVKLPGATRYVPLAAGSSIDVGSLVDARSGTVDLRSALRDGRTQKGRFWGAIFKVRQPRAARGRTDLVLRGGRFGRCPAARGSAVASGVTRDVGRRAVVRRLWGRDRNGRFRTAGRDSVAAVRGTVWSTTDRCDGTVTRVKEGAVLVRNRHTGRRVLIKAGQRYLARHTR